MLREIPLNTLTELKVHGRTTPRRSPLTLFWTASGFECNVSGTELSVEVEVTYDTYEPWFSYTINGDWIGRQMLAKGRYWVPLFRGMGADSIKNVHFYKDMQAMSDDGNSYLHIHAFKSDGEFYPVADKALKLEFIGDSITSGEGLFGARTEEDWVPMFFSALRDYTYLTAKELDAEYRVFSQSGWGVHNKWDNNINGAIPTYYREICSLMPGAENERLGGNKAHDFRSWQPQFIIVNLGTNDVGSFDEPAWTDEMTGEQYKMRKNPDGSYCQEDIKAIQDAVKKFLYILRECNPEAKIIWCYGMLGIKLQTQICDAIAEYASETGDGNVSYLQLPETDDSNIGSRNHPGYLCHKQAAEVLSRYIKSLI